MAVESQSFQNNFGMVEKNEKMFSVASPDNTREETQMSEKTVDSFHTETSDNQNKEMDQPPVSDRECRSRSVSMTSSSRSRSRSSSSSSCSSGGSYSSGSSRRGRRGGNARRRNHLRSYSSSSSSRSRSRSRSRPRPRCHRVRTSLPCCGGHHRRRSPPRRYRARSRSYSPSPVRASHRSRRARSPSHYRSRRRSASRSRSRSGGRRLYGFVGRSRFRPDGALYRRSRTRSHSRSRSRSTSPNRNNIHLTQEEKRALLLIARTNAANALGVEDVALPASVSPAVAVHEEPTIEERVRPCGTALSSLKENHKPSEADEIPSPKMSPRNRITFSIRNTVAKPASSRPSSSPEKTVTVRTDSVTAQNPYGRWVPINARSFPLSIAKSSSTKTR